MILSRNIQTLFQHYCNLELRKNISFCVHSETQTWCLKFLIYFKRQINHFASTISIKVDFCLPLMSNRIKSSCGLYQFPFHISVSHTFHACPHLLHYAILVICNKKKWDWLSQNRSNFALSSWCFLCYVNKMELLVM